MTHEYFMPCHKVAFCTHVALSTLNKSEIMNAKEIYYCTVSYWFVGLIFMGLKGVKSNCDLI